MGSGLAITHAAATDMRARLITAPILQANRSGRLAHSERKAQRSNARAAREADDGRGWDRTSDPSRVKRVLSR
jgi:hypothetical protein